MKTFCLNCDMILAIFHLWFNMFATEMLTSKLHVVLLQGPRYALTPHA